MTHTNKTEQEIKNEVFASYLKQVKGEVLTEDDKANIDAWELTKKHASCDAECNYKKVEGICPYCKTKGQHERSWDNRYHTAETKCSKCGLAFNLHYESD